MIMLNGFNFDRPVVCFGKKKDLLIVQLYYTVVLFVLLQFLYENPPIL